MDGRHRLASVIGTAALAIAAGCQGPHAVAEFALSLNHGQRRRLGCRPKPGARRQFEVPCERTFRRLFARIDPDQLRRAFADWMAALDPAPVQVLHLDGKVLRNADPAPPRLLAQEPAPLPLKGAYIVRVLDVQCICNLLVYSGDARP